MHAMLNILKTADTVVLWKTTLMYLTFTIVGCGYVIPGVSIFDLKLLSNSTTQQISYIIAVRGLFLAVGNLICGLLSKYISNNSIIAAFLLLLAASFATVPWSNSMVEMAVNMSVSGVALGMLQVAISGEIFQLWKQHSSVAVQLLIFFYGLGSFITPLSTRPFLSATMDELSDLQDEVNLDAKDLKIAYPYMFIALVASLLSAALLCMALFGRSNKQSSVNNEKQPDSDEKFSKVVKILVIVFAALFYNVYFGLESVYGQMLTAYAVKFLNLSAQTGALATTVFYGFYAFTRVLGPPISCILSTRTMMIGELALVLVGALLMLFCPESPYIIWIAVAFMGSGVSLLNGSFLSYLNSHLTVGSGIIAIIFTSGCFGEFLHVFAVSLFLQRFPVSFLIVQSYCGIILSLAFLTLDAIVKRNKPAIEQANKVVA